MDPIEDAIAIEHGRQERALSDYLGLEQRLVDLEARVAALESRPDTAALEVRIKCLEQLLSEPDDDEFSIFWKAYPRKVAVAAARKAFKAARKKESLDGLLGGLERYKVDKPAEHPWKHASTWLNGECWRDDYKDRQDAPGSAQAQSGYQDSSAPESKHTRAAVEALERVLMSSEHDETKAMLELHRMARQIRDAYVGNSMAPETRDKNILVACGTLRAKWLTGVGQPERAASVFRTAIELVAANLPQPIGRERFAWPKIK